MRLALDQGGRLESWGGDEVSRGEASMEEEMATHFSILAWWDPWERRLPRNEAQEPYRIMGQAAAGLILCEIGQSESH